MVHVRESYSFSLHVRVCCTGMLAEYMELWIMINTIKPERQQELLLLLLFLFLFCFVFVSYHHTIFVFCESWGHPVLGEKANLPVHPAKKNKRLQQQQLGQKWKTREACTRLNGLLHTAWSAILNVHVLVHYRHTVFAVAASDIGTSSLRLEETS